MLSRTGAAAAAGPPDSRASLHGNCGAVIADVNVEQPRSRIFATLARPRYEHSSPFFDKARGTPGADAPLACARMPSSANKCAQDFRIHRETTRRSVRKGLTACFAKTPGDRPEVITTAGIGARSPPQRKPFGRRSHGARRCAGISRLGPSADGVVVRPLGMGIRSKERKAPMCGGLEHHRRPPHPASQTVTIVSRPTQ